MLKCLRKEVKAMKDYYSFVGKNIQEARKAAGMTQEALAEALDVSLSVISRVETGRTMVSVKRLMEIAQILNVFAGDFFIEPDK